MYKNIWIDKQTDVEITTGAQWSLTIYMVMLRGERLHMGYKSVHYIRCFRSTDIHTTHSICIHMYLSNEVNFVAAL